MNYPQVCAKNTRNLFLPLTPAACHPEDVHPYSHSIISEPLNRLFCLAFCASHCTDTVKDTVETVRWRAIDADRSRMIPKPLLSYSLPPHHTAFRPRPGLPSSAQSHPRTHRRRTARSRSSEKLSKGRCAHLSCEALRAAEFNRRSNGRRIHDQKTECA
jgi:hypothetical protein